MQSDDKDSLTRLLEDVEVAASDNACRYFNEQVTPCAGCPARDDPRPCLMCALDDIARRLHALMPHDAEGREVKVGDTIKRVGTGLYSKVCGIAAKATDGNGFAIACDLGDYRVVEPDSWGMLRTDAMKPPSEYLKDRDMRVFEDDAEIEWHKALDLVQRAEALAGVEQ